LEPDQLVVGGDLGFGWLALFVQANNERLFWRWRREAAAAP